MDHKRVMLVRPRSACGWGFAWSPLAINLEYLGAAILDRVDEVKLVNQEFDETHISKHIRDFEPDLVGVSMCAVDHHTGLDICRVARKRGIATMVGGYHPSAVPDEILANREVDMIVRGEGEMTLREYIDKGSPVGVRGMSYRRKGRVVHEPDRPVVRDLDTLPFPARHLRAGHPSDGSGECESWKRIGGLHRDQVHFSRGCWGRCTFCNEPTMSHSVHRYRSPENTMEEIREIYRFHNGERTLVLFGDPHFMGRPDKVERLSELLIDADLDMIFSVMIRADMVQKHPRVVKKMVRAGIIGSCMGIESPRTTDLKGTSKGMTNEIHERAVGIMRRSHGVAGATFVIGLPGQTEEEIKMFPEYARHLGLINTGYAIATPLPGTPFYSELDGKGLIDDHDYSRYDQMHSVWKHESIGKKRLEQLVTYCVGRFYAPDIFLDDIISEQYRDFDGRKATTAKMADYIRARWAFVASAGPQFQPEESRDYGALFLRSMINPYTRKRTEKIGIHNMMELAPALRVLGKQKIQVTVTNRGEEVAHFVIKTTKDTIEYVDVTNRPHKDATLHISIGMEALDSKVPQTALDLLTQMAKKRQLRVLARTALAGMVDFVALNRSLRPNGKMTIPEEYRDTGCRMDGWSPPQSKMHWSELE